MTNKKKNEQLGMNPGTAANRLRKMVMFSLLQEYGRNICFQCGKHIEDIDNLSIEHKIPWLDSEDPVGTFFDLNNIAFSHMSCNYSAAKTWNKGNKSPHGTESRYHFGCRCSECQIAHAHYRKEGRIRTGKH
jgi:5-methylcytosine-specific restriction endonuclease McrA